MIPLRLPLVCQQIAKRLSDNQTSDMQKNRHQTGNLKSSLSDNRPEAFAASFQTSEGEHQHAFLRKDRFEIRDKRYEGDAEDYYKRGICHIRIFFLCSNKADSTFHQPQAGPPSLSREGNVLHTFPCSNNVESTFHQADDQTGSLWGFLSDHKNSEHLHAFLCSNIYI